MSEDLGGVSRDVGPVGVTVGGAGDCPSAVGAAAWAAHLAELAVKAIHDEGRPGITAIVQAGDAGPEAVLDACESVDDVVVVVPAGDRLPLRQVVVGLDPAPGSHVAAAWAGALAHAAGARLRAVYAYAPPPGDEDDAPVDLSEWAEDGAEHLREWLVPLRATGVDVDFAVVTDLGPVAALNREAAALDADLVVVGCCGRPEIGLDRPVRKVGSVARQLLTFATRPVALVPCSPQDRPG